MLVKSVCKKCFDRYFKSFTYPNYMTFETFWAAGQCFCPYNACRLDTENVAPDFCKYALEQVLNQEPESRIISA